MPDPAANPDQSTIQQEVEALSRELVQVRADLESQQAQRADAVTALLASTRSANANIPGDLISGTTPQEIAASAERAQQLRTQIIAANPTPQPAPQTPPPTGVATATASPPRTMTDTTGMSAVAKIAEAIRTRAS